MTTETAYPVAPGWKAEDTDTSRQAAKAIESPAKTLRQKCHEALKGAAMTADEVAELLGESVLSVRPRVSELKAQGRVEATAKRRCNVSGKTAVVWRAALRQGELL
jgi:predicted ArsR family transcriptional regulator